MTCWGWSNFSLFATIWQARPRSAGIQSVPRLTSFGSVRRKNIVKLGRAWNQRSVNRSGCAGNETGERGGEINEHVQTRQSLLVQIQLQRALHPRSTKQGNDKIARQMEAAHRTSLAKGEVGIREKKQAPLLKDFLKNDFLPFAETKHAAKPLTYRYYRQGADMLTKSAMAGLRLDELTDQHAQAFAAKNSAMSPSGINRGLRALRRAVNLAYQWGKIDKPIKVTLAKGEHQRDRVLTDDETTKCFNACPQPWKDCATIILDEGFRPGEVFALRWPHVLLNEDGTGLIQIVDGESKAARRVLPMTPGVYALLLARHEAEGRPENGWIFPSRSTCGHLNGDAAREQWTMACSSAAIGKRPAASDPVPSPPPCARTHPESPPDRHTPSATGCR